MEGVQVANRTDADGVRKATPKEIAEYKNREAMTVKNYSVNHLSVVLLMGAALRRLLPRLGPDGKMNSGRAVFYECRDIHGVYKKHSGGGLNDTNLVPQGGSGKKPNAVSHGFSRNICRKKHYPLKRFRGVFN